MLPIRGVFDIMQYMENSKKNRNSITTRDILNAHGINLLKSKGQNFLIDANIPEKIVRLSGIDDTCGVLEVGPGIGALTIELAKTAKNVVSVELDKRLIPILDGVLACYENVKIIQGDILKIDLNETINKYLSGTNNHICANLPYNITTPALTAFIDSGAFKSITIMIQKEFAQRICATPGTPQYGALTVYANYHTEPQILFDVPPECFTPRPKVTSSVVKLTVKQEKPVINENEKTFFRIVRASFEQRRKTLVNSLYSSFSNTHDKDEIKKIIINCGFDERIRGEALCVEDFVKILKQFVTICN